MGEKQQSLINSGLASESESEPTEGELPAYKLCGYCQQQRPLSHFMRRSGRRSGANSRRGACRTCRKQRKNSAAGEQAAVVPAAAAKASIVRGTSVPGIGETPPPPRHPHSPGFRAVRPRPLAGAAELARARVGELRPTRAGILRMRGRTDKGRRWHQETDLATAVNLVMEHAAVVVNSHTVRRLFTNRSFKQYLLKRDRYTCYFCGNYGDTIDHLLPRAKGGHTTPVNCVCACNECNQSKGSKDLDEFLESLD
ncbi:HNH endonuclease [Paenibacillus gansuensis]|uniref:HNH endonuclease n=1 Tax=Paenibacillus gansuensis TaxID=306542 RepID=A0ABW5P7N4_9BACL